MKPKQATGAKACWTGAVCAHFALEDGCAPYRGTSVNLVGRCCHSNYAHRRFWTRTVAYSGTVLGARVRLCGHDYPLPLQGLTKKQQVRCDPVWFILARIFLDTLKGINVMLRLSDFLGNKPPSSKRSQNFRSKNACQFCGCWNIFTVVRAVRLQSFLAAAPGLARRGPGPEYAHAAHIPFDAVSGMRSVGRSVP